MRKITSLYQEENIIFIIGLGVDANESVQTNLLK
jgi:hypothetical protein